jgi:outer membrane protein assembly factor BamD
MKTIRAIALVALVAVLFAACHHAQKQSKFKPVIDPEMAKLTKEQVFDRGEEWFAKRKYAKARSWFSFVYENFPNDPLARRALLRVADTYYAQGDAVNLVEAQYKYRDFINRYPSSDRSDYAMLQIAMVSYKQMEKPDRDQQKTREAVEKFHYMIRTYPNSQLRPEADKRLSEVEDRLARHEQIVARYYMKRKSWLAAVQRLNGLVEQYPNYRDRASVFYDLATVLDSLGRRGEARLYYERVVTEFPKSEYATKAKRRLDTMKA